MLKNGRLLLQIFFYDDHFLHIQIDKTKSLKLLIFRVVWLPKDGKPDGKNQWGVRLDQKIQDCIGLGPKQIVLDHFHLAYFIDHVLD